MVFVSKFHFRQLKSVVYQLILNNSFETNILTADLVLGEMPTGLEIFDISA